MNPPRIAIVGEAWGKDEEQAGLPFIGASGKELDSMLKVAGIHRGSCLVTNVFNCRPPGNQVAHFFCPKKEGVHEVAFDGEPPSHLAPLRPGKYLKPTNVHHLQTLRTTLLEFQPSLILALGATASWALLNLGKIASTRGVVAASTLCPGIKVLPTYHPAAVLRNYSLRPIALADLIKAKREAADPAFNPPSRKIWVEPTISDICAFKAQHLDACSTLAFDIETKPTAGVITCIGFAPTNALALVIPFYHHKTLEPYWEDQADEVLAWSLVRDILALPCTKVGQNGLYDIQWLWRKLGIPVRNYAHDTMLLHHALYPELPKDLGFLGSLYTNEPSWKGLSKTAKLFD